MQSKLYLFFPPKPKEAKYIAHKKTAKIQALLHKHTCWNQQAHQQETRNRSKRELTGRRYGLAAAAMELGFRGDCRRQAGGREGWGGHGKVAVAPHLPPRTTKEQEERQQLSFTRAQCPDAAASPRLLSAPQDTMRCCAVVVSCADCDAVLGSLQH